MAVQSSETTAFTIRTLDEVLALAVNAAQVCAYPGPVALGLAELLVNAIEHGNLGIDYAEKARLQAAGTWMNEVARRQSMAENHHKRVRLEIASEGSRRHFRIRDEGPGFDWRRFLDSASARALAPNGRGIALARRIAFSGLEFCGAGNEVHAWVDEAEEECL
jgi:anti-sigma regulatory factor (Ser/Thr protein kinase)